MNRFLLLLTMALLALPVAPASADVVKITGGRTDISLDDTELAAVGLEVSRYSDDVIDPSPRGGDFVGFLVNSRDAAERPTTFSYTVDDLFPVSGTVEHSGSVFLNSTNPNLGAGEIEFSELSIGFDAAREAGANSGFFVSSRVAANPPLILFDIGASGTGIFPADETGIRIESSLLLSNELATVLGGSATAGSNVGALSVNGVTGVPEPAGGVLLTGLTALVAFRRKR